MGGSGVERNAVESEMKWLLRAVAGQERADDTEPDMGLVVVTINGRWAEGVRLPTMEYRYDEGRLQSIAMQGEVIWQLVKEG